MKPVVFIHTNRKQLLGARVAAYSMHARSANPHKFDVRILEAENYPELSRRHGERYLREGREVLWDTNDLQSFTPLRFVPPGEMHYTGRALVTDPDVFAVGDVWELLSRDMQGKAVLARQIAPTDGRSSYFASSVMLLDCAKLRHWDWRRQIDEMFSLKVDYRSWVSLDLEDPSTIGPLEEKWNHFDTLNETTKLLHNTGRLTQPWRTGLAIDFNSEKLPDPLGKKWGIVPRPWIRGVKRLLLGSSYIPITHYQRHPDSAQEAYFFRLLREAIEAGAVPRSMISEALRESSLRADAPALLGGMTLKEGDEARL